MSGDGGGTATDGDEAGAIRVERGPDWLFVGLGQGAARRDDLAEGVCRLVQASMAHRVVLELDEVESMDERLAEAIAAIGTRVRGEGGLVRICGLSDANLSRLQSVSAAALVPHFGSRVEAVGGHDQRIGTP